MEADTDLPHGSWATCAVGHHESKVCALPANPVQRPEPHFMPSCPILMWEVTWTVASLQASHSRAEVSTEQVLITSDGCLNHSM